MHVIVLNAWAWLIGLVSGSVSKSFSLLWFLYFPVNTCHYTHICHIVMAQCEVGRAAPAFVCLVLCLFVCCFLSFPLTDVSSCNGCGGMEAWLMSAGSAGM